MSCICEPCSWCHRADLDLNHHHAMNTYPTAMTTMQKRKAPASDEEEEEAAAPAASVVIGLKDPPAR